MLDFEEMEFHTLKPKEEIAVIEEYLDGCDDEEWNCGEERLFGIGISRDE